MAYIRWQNYMLLLDILLCDIDITFCNMHGLFGYLLPHYEIKKVDSLDKMCYCSLYDPKKSPLLNHLSSLLFMEFVCQLI